MVKRGKTRFIYCKVNPKHKQRQGFHTTAGDLFFGQHASVVAAPRTLRSSLPVFNFDVHSKFQNITAPKIIYNPSVGITSILNFVAKK